MATDEKPQGETAAFRTASNVGFNARVEPVYHSLEQLRPKLGFFEHRRRRKRLERLLDLAAEQLARQGADGRSWIGAGGTCVCNLRVARLGFLNELRKYAVRKGGAEAADRFPHLLRHRDRNSYYLPVRFPQPFTLEAEGGDTVPFGSATELAEELADLNTALKVESSFRMTQMVDFLDATPKDISAYESTHGSEGPFWVRLGYVMLQKLARKSLEHQLPIIFA
jgi:hypothetical protein